MKEPKWQVDRIHRSVDHEMQINVMMNETAARVVARHMESAVTGDPGLHAYEVQKIAERINFVADDLEVERRNERQAELATLSEQELIAIIMEHEGKEYTDWETLDNA